MKLGIISVFFCAVLYFGGYFLYFYFTGGDTKEAFDAENWVNPLDKERITDNADIYQDDVQTKADKIYVTVFQAAKKSDQENLTFQDIIKYSKSNETADVPFKVFFQDANKTLLDNGIFVRETNAELELRGKSPGNDVQKSFQLTLHDKEGLWHNQKVINLVKDYKDPLRIRNKLAFDYFSIMPDITSLRTRLVRLFIKDLSASPNAEFEDYGLFTQIEHPNKLFLTNHQLDPNAHLYKAENFNFSRYPEYIKNKNDSSYVKQQFEEILEIRGSDDHQKLINMLEAVNDPSVNIDDIIQKYFDKENYLTWLAANILFDNPQVTHSNFFLYSPLNSTKWYFMPWDYDEAWGLITERPTWQKGVAVYWDNVLHRRFLEKPGNIEQLNQKVEELRAIVNEARTKAFLDSYYDIIMSNITQLPDIKYLPITIDTYEKQYQDFPAMVARNLLYYYELQENPMPVLLDEPEQFGHKILFHWDQSVDLQGDNLAYDLEISQVPDFSTVLTSIKDLKETKTEINNLSPGIYFWRVVVKDDNGHSQMALNVYEDDFGDKYFGIKRLIVKQ
ncbi:MAG: CotH kinase family protein [Thermincola sp.]|jgi:spore coat protein H|nr:CotH kinase family protein [Thermincola sp.]MDT3704101.1 CotH kinase family protein [Thermincola sp.]